MRLAVLLSLILFLVILFLDIGSLCSGGANISKLSARIESLNSSNSLLQEDLTLAMSHPVLQRANADEAEETVITLTAALP